MPETTPNSKGPAPAQMSPEQAASLGLTPALIPADQVKPEDIGTLSIEYRDGKPVLVISGGKYVPVGLTAVDGSGNAVDAHTASQSRESSFIAYQFHWSSADIHSRG
ncbi:hypothetical protein [Streptomyces sp. NPDC056069]|uniref:hypothetical protein n=1 Tax=Streptomyces sp. NPDC056069 TaxID=3345702 RepID=UPI0035D6A0A8